MYPLQYSESVRNEQIPNDCVRSPISILIKESPFYERGHSSELCWKKGMLMNTLAVRCPTTKGKDKLGFPRFIGHPSGMGVEHPKPYDQDL